MRLEIADTSVGVRVQRYPGQLRILRSPLSYMLQAIPPLTPSHSKSLAEELQGEEGLSLIHLYITKARLAVGTHA
jgi:hypothetical protein